MNAARLITTEGHFLVNTQHDPKSGRILIKKDSPEPMTRLEQLITACIWGASIALVLSILSAISDDAAMFFMGLPRLFGAF